MVSIAIIREENESETRTPLIPEDIEFLKQKFDINTYIQPSSQRIYSDSEYTEKGGIIEEDIQKKADFIFALNETPVKLVLNGRKYKSLVIFSHSLIEQEINQEMLTKIIRSKSSLIDYDKVVDEKNKKVFHFDSFIEYAGMIDSFWALGLKLKNQGLETPLLKINQSYKYSSLENAKDSIKKIGKEIDIIGLNFPDGPLIIGILGSGTIPPAIKEILDCIPNQEMTPEELEQFFESGYYSENRIYYVFFKEKYLVKPIDLADDYELNDYYTNPEKYESQFEKYIPYLTMIINTFSWKPKFPKFLTINGLKSLYEGGLILLRVIGDLSCQVNGVVELTLKITTSKEPVFTFDLTNGNSEDGFRGKGPTILAIDNFPGELSKDASKSFSNLLKNYIPKITNANYKLKFAENDLPDEVKKGMIVFKGELTPDFNHLSNLVK